MQVMFSETWQGVDAQTSCVLGRVRENDMPPARLQPAPLVAPMSSWSPLGYEDACLFGSRGLRSVRRPPRVPGPGPGGTRSRDQAPELGVGARPRDQVPGLGLPGPGPGTSSGPSPGTWPRDQVRGPGPGTKCPLHAVLAVSPWTSPHPPPG